MAAVLEKLPIGTNLALYQFLWMLISAALHNSRGAMFPALKSIGLEDDEVRWAWAAMRKNAGKIKSWRITTMSSDIISAYAGSRWVRVDLHLHSPGANLFKYPKNLDALQKDEVVKRYVRQIKDQGIEIAAITDYQQIHSE